MTKNKGLFCVYIILSIAIYSCQNYDVKVSKNKNNAPYKQTLELKVIGEKKFLLDSSSTQNIESDFFYEEKTGNARYFSFFNKYNESIYFYNYESGNLAFITKLQKDGSNGVGKATGYYVQNLDSIFVLDPWGAKMTIVNKLGHKINSFSLNSNNTSKLLPTPKLCSTNPMLFKNDKFILTGNTFGEFDEEDSTNRPVVITYNTNDRSIKYSLSYPSIYQNANWASYNFRDIFSTFNEEKNTLIVSFPADHYLYQYNCLNGDVKKFYAGSRNFGDIISIHRRKNFKVRDADDLFKYFGTQPSYSSVIYDKYRKLYYRVAEMPIKKYDKDEKKNRVKQFSIIILNDKFQIQGETIIPHLSHTRLVFYVSEEGLNMRKYTEDDDHLTFTVFLPVIHN